MTLQQTLLSKTSLLSKLFFGALLLGAALSAQAQELVPEAVEIVRARVAEVVSERVEQIPGTSASATVQTLRIEVLEGEQAGETIALENDYLLLKAGETFYLRHAYDSIDDIHRYAVSAPDRLPVLGLLFALFLGVLFFFGGKQGVRGLLALAGSLLVILYVLLPLMLMGYPPVLVAMAVCSVIVVLGSYITHGVNRTTSAAVLGMLATIGITGILAYLAIGWTRLSGYSGEEVSYLFFDTGGSIDLVGLLLAGIMIGLLGVLYDAGVGQAVAVEELFRAGSHLKPHEVYKRGIRIGREHIGALVNTLAIAYVGASLPLLLLLQVSYDQSIWLTLNQELFATEIVRTIVGSIGLILAVPLTTAIAVWLLARDKKQN